MTKDCPNCAAIGLKGRGHCYACQITKWWDALMEKLKT